MDTTTVAAWLNSALAPFDYAVLEALHVLAELGGGALTPLFGLVSLVGEKGICFFALALLLMVFRRTRKVGVCMFVAICLGALATNIVLKDLVERPRPFEASAAYLDWWRFVGAPSEDGFSFPSGHMTAAASAMAALMLAHRGWQTVLGGMLVMVCMGVARCYLVAHYPTDVLAAVLVGVLAALVAWALTSWAFRMLSAWGIRWAEQPDRRVRRAGADSSRRGTHRAAARTAGRTAEARRGGGVVRRDGGARDGGGARGGQASPSK